MDALPCQGIMSMGRQRVNMQILAEAYAAERLVQNLLGQELKARS
jgi:hypothetical protein